MGRRRKFKSGGNESEITINKSKKYKWDSKGDFVEYTGDATKNEITVSGSKSNLRRLAEIERNIGILATTLTTSDDGTDDGNNASFSKNVNQTTRFKKAVRMDKTLNMQETIDMNGDKITEVGTCTSGTDAANKTYVDLQISNLGDTAPAALNTLNELAAAMNDDASFSATVTNSIATKLPKTGGAMTGAITTNSTFDGRDVATDGAKLDTVASSANNYSLPSSVVHDTEPGALHASDAISISGHTITLTRGDSTTETVVVPDNNDNTTYTAGNGLGLSGTVFSMDGQYTGDLTVSGDITAQGGDMTATRFNGEATTAKYADLAERYAADAPYEEGTVVMFGGEAEVTSAQGYGSTKIAGVVSTKPAFAMNETAGNSETHPYIALQGRVPCKVMGTVSKGDILVASEVSGIATAWLESSVDPRMTAYVGIAIEDKTTDTVGYIEVKVGK
jgi:hypothetical protein